MLWFAGGIGGLVLVGVLAYYLYGKIESDSVLAPAPAPEIATAPAYTPPSRPAPVPAPAPAPAARPSIPRPTPPHAAPTPPAPAAKARANAPGNLERLEGAFYLFGQSINEAGNGYRTAYTVLNSDIAAGEPLAGQVKSQVFRVVMNCANSTWAYDQRFYYAMQFGEGERLAERKWQTDEMKWKPLRDSLQDRKLYGFLCR